MVLPVVGLFPLLKVNPDVFVPACEPSSAIEGLPLLPLTVTHGATILTPAAGVGQIPLAEFT